MLRHDFMTNDEDSQWLAHQLGNGAVVAGLLTTLFGSLAGTVVGTAPGTVAAVICAILGAFAALWSRRINYKNEGCGVVTNVNHLPVPPGPVPPVPKLSYDFYVTTQ